MESNLTKLIIIGCSLLSSFIVIGCQERVTIKEVTPQKLSTANEVPTNLNKKQQCNKSYSAPIKDTTKLMAMLIKSGKITAEMTEAEVKVAINEYIRKKRAAFKKCYK